VDIKSIVQEQLKQIEETYDSVHEIRDIANDIIVHVSKLNAGQYKQQRHFTYIQGTFLRDVAFKKKPVELLQFVTQSQLYISFTPRQENQDSTGRYNSNFNDPSILKRTEIEVFYDKAEIARKIEEDLKKDYYSHNSVYNTFYYAFIATIIHELQHAYDDFRSRGRAYRTKQFKAFNKKYWKSGENKEVKFAELDDQGRLEKFKSYLKLPHEIWARFSEAFQRIGFYKSDWHEDPNDPNSLKVIYTMEPMKESIRDLKIYMPNFSVLDQATKERLYKAVIAYWHIAKERLPAYQEMQNKKFNEKGNGDDDLTDLNLAESKENVSIDYANGKILLNGEPVGVVELFDRGNGYVVLDKILVYDTARGQGIATQAMKQIIDKYRAERKIITLTPDSVYGANKNKLIRWYTSLGFVLNKGKNKDFKTMQLMYLPLS
jgi:GNAT superfamily N-acetyltransferase